MAQSTRSPVFEELEQSSSNILDLIGEGSVGGRTRLSSLGATKAGDREENCGGEARNMAMIPRPYPNRGASDGVAWKCGLSGSTFSNEGRETCRQAFPAWIGTGASRDPLKLFSDLEATFVGSHRYYSAVPPRSRHELSPTISGRA
ncbi:hypothetical protein SNOG_02808 [Parastagonospora nodorum SN15]|uniref:Uncharacterized protein n=1 Tax=Phaeosphaeria nodorum (strain SN15 / ATCC MYA-4574 / FGSC 10173) TaxID=321614 RepID=Q0UZK6_PHANO|nr:hypothetical protein SNOG_02808 [Parastagonospora nodorum SN15]EAT89539.1 hypothetical protein SNOG_02808 [Parastagonospora nodorum SN15]